VAADVTRLLIATPTVSYMCDAKNNMDNNAPSVWLPGVIASRVSVSDQVLGMPRLAILWLYELSMHSS
jgi:hypothetical protein